jgi:hypothetical protein
MNKLCLEDICDFCRVAGPSDDWKEINSLVRRIYQMRIFTSGLKIGEP